MVKRSGATHYEPISWSAAFELIAAELRALPSPDAAAFYTSGRTSNEAAFLYQLLARRFGTNNLPDCSNMCHEASGMALTETIGIGKGSVHITDFVAADLIVVVGQNPGTNHPRMLTTLEAAKRAGTTIVAINPLPEAGLQRFKNPQRPSGLFGSGTQLADEHLPIRINGDLAFFKAVNHLLVTAGDPAGETSLDTGFIERVHERLRPLRRRRPDRSTGSTSPAPPVSPATSPNGSPSASVPPSASSSAGRWASRSTPTRWRRSARWSTSC